MNKDTSSLVPSPSSLGVSARVRDLIRPEIQALSAYHVPDASGMIKLDAMENPYHWPESLLNKWQEVLHNAELNRYPDPAASKLKTRLRVAMEIPETAEILLGNGSDEIIQIILMAVSGKGRVVLAPEPGFVMYQMIATYTDMDYVGVPLKQDFTLDLPAMLAAIEQHQPAVIFLAYPNNPTGNLFNVQDIEHIIKAAPGVVVIDEAYHAFADSSYMSRVMDYENVFVMRTVSKMGLAGLRLGLLVGEPEWLNEFDKVRLPYNINILTQLSVEFALEHKSVLEAQTDLIKSERSKLFKSLSEFKSFKVFPSNANFILLRTEKNQASQIFDALKKHHILIKNLDKAGGMLKDCLRITVGTENENNQLIVALKNIIQQ